MATSKRIHWRAPTSMAAALICGIALSLGHHFFYATLDGQLTPIGSYHVVGKSMSKQQFNTAIGTAFAFLVKAALTVAITIGYIQVFWWTVNKAKKGSTLAELDTISALGNLVSLFDVANWWRHPLLFGLALIFWCIPLATIITPATLSVSTAPRKTFPSTNVPHFDFTSLAFTKAMEFWGGTPETIVSGFWPAFAWDAASQPVQNIASAVLMQGQILPIAPPTSNSSWILNFWGPALQCSAIDGAQRDAVWVGAWNALPTIGISSSPFFTWIPPNDTQEPPYLTTDAWGGSGEFSTGGPATLYVATLPNMLKVAARKASVGIYPDKMSSGIECGYSRLSTVQQLDEAMICGLNVTGSNFTGSNGTGSRLPIIRPSFAFEGASLLRCNLVNASHTASFSYTNGIQDIKVSRNSTDRSSPLTMLGTVSLLENPGGDTRCSASLQQDDDSEYQEGSWNFTLPCSVNATVLQQLAYQSIFSAFVQNIQGGVAHYGSGYLEFNTLIMTTVLAQTDELDPIRSYENPTAHSDLNHTSLQSVMHSSNGTAFRGLANDVPKGTRGSLKAALERAFENITMSLLSDPYLQPNTSSQFAPSLSTTVTVETTVAFYVYDRTTLWIAYGLAILFSTFVVAVGLAFLVISGASYDTTFSTIVRVARAAHLNADLMVDEGAGYQPLPKRLAKARLAVGSASPPLLAQVEMDDLGPQRQKLNVESNSLLAASEESSVRNRRH
ncbi:hypothetical protein LTR27_010931 [Elasticomyces elasticus]|nr:hypothetical protein LTR27_010931 [Elasticomyces elasticus]